MATHRPALLALADRILHTEGGAITEQFTQEHRITDEPFDLALEGRTDRLWRATMASR